jgi:hypothetical protein
LSGSPVFEAPAPTQVNGRDDLTAKIDQTANHVRSKRHPSHFLVLNHLLHFWDRCTEYVTIEKEGAEL